MHNNIGILIVEDDFFNRRLLVQTLKGSGYLTCEAASAKEAMDLLIKHSFSLALLDINLGEEKNEGIKLAAYIKEHIKLPIIFLTAYETPAIIDEALQQKPVAYITKPFKKTDLIVAIELGLQQSDNQGILNSKSILVKDRAFNVQLAIEEINYIEASGNYLLIFAKGKVFTQRSSLKNVLQTLPDGQFVQVHRSFVVNKLKIEKYNSRMVVINKREIPVSKKYPAVEALLGIRD